MKRLPIFLSVIAGVVLAFTLKTRQVKTDESPTPRTAVGEHSLTPPKAETFSSAPPERVASQDQATPEDQGFIELIENAKKGIPSREEIRKLRGEAVHDTPSLLIRAADGIGQVDEAMDRNPELFDRGARFYAECVENDQYPQSVRALCLKSLRQKARQFSVPVEKYLALETIPESVRFAAE